MVVSGASSSARGNGIDRFYNPPAVRRHLQQQQQQLLQQQQQQQQQEQRQRNRHRSPQESLRTKPRPLPSTSPENSPAIDETRVESDDSSSKSAVTSSSNSNSSSLPPPTPPIPAGNLDRFLESTTPVVPAQYVRKTSVRGWMSSDTIESGPYYNLGDLWESLKEWSAYGAGVPLVLNGHDSVIQYYVPYLSGIQLYVDSSRHSLRSRQRGKDSDVETYHDTSSESSSSIDGRAGQEGSFGDDREGRSQVSKPIFEYLARDSPYGREPLADKISALANKFPGLKTYKSCDLLPSSWMCVAWYPIYRIPTGHTLKDLDACFLTFHSLSTHYNNLSNGHSVCNGGAINIRRASSASQMSAKLPVPVFGLASYKLKGSIWASNGQHEQLQASSLLQAADNWLRLLNVDHPDFQFFLSRYNMPWR